jgi:hypothetical protein
MSHYYGDIVRRLFLIAAFVMAATLPYFSPLIGKPLLMSIVGILVLAVAAGLTSPAYSLSSILNALVAIGAVVVFETYAVQRFSEFGTDVFFLINQALALIFLVAFYFGMKTLRSAAHTTRASDR